MLDERTWQIRPVAAHDSFFADYCRMRIALWPDCAAECESEALEQVANGEGAAVFVAAPDTGAAVGFVEISLRNYAEGASISPIPYIEGWFVESACRGRGAGRALLDAAEQWALARGFREIASDSQLENTGSLAAHLHLGYQEVERSVCFLKRLR